MYIILLILPKYYLHFSIFGSEFSPPMSHIDYTTLISRLESKAVIVYLRVGNKGTLKIKENATRLQKM